jgi:SNF2 family DNA or RNA helicase
MFASRKYNKLIIKTKYATQLKAIMPQATLSQDFPGVIYAPWDIAHSQQLARIGYANIPAPIEKDYHWAGDKHPYVHQHATAGFCTLYKRGFILNGLGSGKTNSVLWAIDYLMYQREVQKALIICNVSTLDVVWGDTLYYEFFNRKFAVLTGSAARRNKLFADPKYDFYIINHDAFSIIKEQYLKRTDINAIVIDEMTAYKDAGTRRFKRLRNAFKDNPPKYLWAMTAEPTPNEPTDAWGPSKLLGLNRGISFTAFKDMTMQKVSTFKWVVRPDSQKIVASILSPSIRFATRDCIDLPETIYSTRKAELSPMQHKFFSEMINKYTVDFSDGVASAVNEADKQNKLLQIACGFIYSRDATNQVLTQHIDPTERLKVLDEILELNSGKAIIFVPYTELIYILYNHLSKKKSCRIVYGDISKAERYEIFTLFQKSPTPEIIIAHPRTMAHGITLTAAATIIWYAPYASNEYYSQANGRIVRPSQTKVTNIIHIVATELEKRIYNKLARRQQVQGTLLDYVKELQNGRSND